MKIPSGLLLLFLTLALSVRAEEAGPMKTEAAAVKRELVWPEIKDPQALIDFAKAEIAKLKASGKESSDLDESTMQKLAYLHPSNCAVTLEYILITIETKPTTGQALLILPDSKALSEKYKESRHRITDTTIPEIKHFLWFMDGDYNNQLRGLEGASVRWRNIHNLDKNKCTWPTPLVMPLPGYPFEMIRQGIDGEAKAEFTVSKQGLVTELKVTATHSEFEDALRSAVQYWRFESGIDLETRMSSATHISLTVKFISEAN